MTDRAVALSVALFLLLFGFLGIYLPAPPAAVPATAAASAFSSARAMAHLTAIAQEPRPIGSPAHARVRAYLVEELTRLDIEHEVQVATVVGQRQPGPPFIAATVHNVVARLRGTGEGEGVLLVAHYDTLPHSPGASDNGVAVSALLETLRALKENPPLEHDVMVLFSDAEEFGSLGASAFLEKHPWGEEVALVLNFEARGNRGASMLFESSPDNRWLIQEFAQAAPHPVASSLAFEVYQILPNDTDLTIFKNSGLPGLNFAFFDGLLHYDTPLDRIEDVDERLLQHHGSYALALARHFGNLPLESEAAENLVYFDILGITLFRYPESWVLPLTLVTLALFIGTLALGVRRGGLKLIPLLLAFFWWLLTVVVVALLSAGITYLAFVLRPEFLTLHEPYNVHLYLLGLLFLSLAITATFYNGMRERLSFPALYAAALLWWALLLVGSSLVLPGASYLFLWPLLFSLLFYLITLLRGETIPPLVFLLLLLLLAVPSLVLLVPTIHQVFIALTFSLAAVGTLLLVLLFVLLLPHLEALLRPHRWFLPAGTALVGLGLLLGGLFLTPTDAEHPRPTNVFYLMRADEEAARWVSEEAKIDEWSSQFFPAGTGKSAVPDIYPLGGAALIHSQAPLAPLEAPEVALLDDETSEGVRTLRFRIASPRRAPVLSLVLRNQEVLAAFLDDQPIHEELSEAQQRIAWRLFYWGLPEEGVELELQLRATGEAIVIEAIDQSFELPEIPGLTYRPRSPEQLATSAMGDSTTIIKHFTFAP